MEITQGLTKQEYNDIKQAAKSEIPFRVSFGYATAKYCLGAIHIHPVKESGKHEWTDEQFKAVYTFIKSHKLTAYMLDGQYNYYTFKSGINYISKLIAK